MLDMQHSHVLSITNRTGDTEVRWNPDDPVSTAEAKRQFDMLRSIGDSVYRKESNGSATVVHSFDAQATELVSVPRISGG